MGPDDLREAAEFCERVRPRLVGALSLYCGDSGVAEELAQETLARVWDRWAQVSALNSPEAWAHRVGINLAHSLYRRRAAERRARARAGHDAEAPESAAHSDPDHSEVLALRAALRELSPRQRTAVVLRFYADLSVEQTADAMGCAQGTVKSLTHRAMAVLRVEMGPTELEVADHA